MSAKPNNAQIELYAMNRKGLCVVHALIENFGPEIFSRIITASDPNNLDDCCFEITEICATHGIPVFKKNDQIPKSDTDFTITAGWRWMIETSSKKKIIVLHDSLLPKYRGFAPLVSALINRDKLIGVTALFAVGSYDAGEIITQRSIELDGNPLKLRNAIQKIATLYAEIATSIVNCICSGAPLQSSPQDESKATYSLWRDEDDFRIDWTQSSEDIRRFIYAVGFPYKGASCKLQGKKLRILEAMPISDVAIENRDPGKTIFLRDGYPVVVCGKGLLLLQEVVDESGSSCLPFQNFRLRFN